jgi:hypothetical protein
MTFDNDQSGIGGLVAGHYLYRRDLAQMLPVPIMVEFAAPRDPETGERLDRSPRWQFWIRGKLYGSEDPPYWGGFEVDEDRLDKIWPKCMRWPIDEEEYEFLVARHQWAIENDHDDPHGGDIKIDPMTAPLD